MWRSLIAGLALVGGGLLHAAEWPVFANDAEADGWLRAHSPFYAQMAGEIDGRGGLRYTANPGHPKAGDIHFENGQRCLALGEELRGVERVSVMIFEMTNAYQEERHHEIDARAKADLSSKAVITLCKFQMSLQWFTLDPQVQPGGARAEFR